MPILSQEFTDILFRLPALFIALTIHELSHGLVAYWFHDDTAKRAGRLTLNPLKHIDPIGAVMLILFRFGWAKPVPINPDNFSKKKLGIVFSSLAGPISNFLMAFIFSIPYIIIATGEHASSLASVSFAYIAVRFLSEFVLLNIALGTFNLLPIPPLDGSKVLFSILPDWIYYEYILRYERYGMILILILSFTGLLSKILNPMFEAVFWLMTTVLNPIINLIS